MLRIIIAIITVLTISAGPKISVISGVPSATAKEAGSKPSGLGNKIGPRITNTLQQMRSLGITRGTARQHDLEGLSNMVVRVNAQGEIQSYIYVTDITLDVLSTIESLGITIQIANEEHDIIQALVPFEVFERLSELDFVTRISTPGYGRTRIGSVTTEGDALMMTDLVRINLGITGLGAKVGVISDGVSNSGSPQLSGDLPAVTVNPALGGLGDEGTAILEIIHDIAPGAELFFTGGSGGVPTELEFIDGVTWLRNTAQVDVIIDDIGYFFEPYFEDGIVALAYRSAVVAGVNVTSAGGNDALSHYQDMFVEEAGATGLHDFGVADGGASDTELTVALDAGDSALITLEWDDPFNNAVNDYDLLILTPPVGLVCIPANCLSVIFQPGGSTKPLEAVSVQNPTGGTLQIPVSVELFAGVPREIEMFVVGADISKFNVPGDSVFGHPAANGVIAAGAVDALFPNSVEPFSSRGPSTIVFPGLQIRQKPNVLAPDGVSVTGAGGFPSTFFGTSAAAPHVAGVLALMIEGNPTLTPGEYQQILQDTAVALGGIGGGSGSGIGTEASARTLIFDPDVGFGFIDALAAVEEAIGTTSGGGIPPSSPTPSPSPSQSPSPTPSPSPFIVPSPSSTLPPSPIINPTGGADLIPPAFARNEGGCSIAGVNVGMGIAALNLLIPALPLGVAFGLRYLRRRRERRDG